MKRVLLPVFLLLIFFGCSNKPVYEIKMGLNTWPGYEPLFLAGAMGFYKDTRVSTIRVSSSSDTIKAFKSGILDVAALTMDEVLRLRQEIPEVTVFLVLDISDGGDAIVGQKGISSMAALKGKTVGVEAGALGAYVLTRAVELTPGLTMSDLEIFPVTYENHEKVFLERDVDAVVTFEPVKSRLLEQGGKTLFDSTRIPNEIIDVLIVRNTVLHKHPESIKMITQGWFRAQAYIKDHPKEALAVMAGYEELDLPSFEGSYRSMHFPGRGENRSMLLASNPGILKSVETVKANLFQNRILFKNVSLEGLFSDRYLDGENE